MMRIELSTCVLAALWLTAQTANAGWSKVSDFQASWLKSGALGTATTDGPLVAAGKADAAQATFDAGTTWISLKAPALGNFTSLSIQDRKIWLGSEKQGVAYSGDGVNWTTSNNGMLNPFLGNVAPSIYDVLYVSASELLAGSSAYAFVTVDGAGKWEQLATAGLPTTGGLFGSGLPVNALTKNAAGTTILAATDGGIYRSADGWTWSASGLSGNKIKAISFSSSASYALSDTSGLMVSTDNGTTWASANFTGGTPTALYADTSSANVAVGTASGVVAVSKDGGKTWSTVSDSTLGTSGIKALTWTTGPDKGMFAATASGIFRLDEASGAKLALSPSTNFNFGSILVGRSGTATISLSNSGTAAATLGTFSLKAPFAVSSDCGNTLAAGASCKLTVTFAPKESDMTQSTQKFSDTLATSGFTLPGSPLVFSGSTQLPDFPGATLNGELSTTYTSRAFGLDSVPFLNLTTIQVSEITDDDADGNVKYSINGGPFTQSPGKIKIGDIIRMQITSSPRSGEFTRGEAIFSDELGLRYWGAAYSVSTKGVKAGALALSPAGSFEFGNIVAGQSGSTSVKLTNTSSVKLDLSGLKLPAPFTLSHDCQVTIAPSASCSLSIGFSPLSTDTVRGGKLYSEVLRISGLQSDQSSVSVSYNLTATALPKPLPTVFSSNPGIEQSTYAVSNEIDPQLKAPVSISISGGEYSINDAAYTSTAGTLQPGESIRVRHLSASQPGTEVKTTLTIGSASYVFTSKTTGTPFAAPDGSLPSNILNVQSLSSVLDNNKPLSTLTVDVNMQEFLRIFNVQTGPQGFSAVPSYNVYVAGILPGGLVVGIPSATLFLKNKERSWVGVSSPLAAYLENVSNSSKVSIEVLSDFDFGLLSGVEFYIGLGTSDTEMLSAKRYRAFYKVP